MPNTDTRVKPRKPGPEAVLVPIARLPRERRRELSRRAWRGMSTAQRVAAGPLILLVLFVAVALTVCPPLYALFGTDVPGLVNDAGDKGPVSAGERAEAWVIWVPWMAMIGFLFWRGVRARLRAPYLAVDPEGVWPVFGGRVEAGLEWARVAAVGIGGGRVELFPVDAIKDSAVPTVLDGLVVNAAPPARGLRGKRYSLDLPDGLPAGDLAAARDAVTRFGGTDKLIDLPRTAPLT
ncbi:hypothetical protein [Spirillospora sp. NPDC047279]|uniref:hypothetical protein n=1 Tax=Spirillospora sp. NPDC047279 TaxID=3155478 RepID=UPI0033D37D5F